MPLNWKKNPLLVFVVFTAVHQRNFVAFVFVGRFGALKAKARVSLKKLEGLQLKISWFQYFYGKRKENSHSCCKQSIASSLLNR